ncbi:hypothetical protein [Colwellia piezophila]|uniref:hypothetical protein n=1 Tax=Colwellia piezophila TaxID=211668 RepID=UPI0012FBF8E3|nr:hypothetical protein [Colwellia piezophila]
MDNDILYIKAEPSSMIETDSDLLADTIGSVMASIFRISDGGEFARIFRCKPEYRNNLLKMMRGDKAEEVDMDMFNTPVEDTFGARP